MKPMRKNALLIFLLAASTVGLVSCAESNHVGPTNAALGADCSDASTALIGCDTFHSVSAADGGTAVEWVGDLAIDLRAEFMNAQSTLVVTTPCNTLNVAVEIEGDTLTPDSIASTMKGLRR
ncbi:heat shock protein HslJ [Microbacterium halimionae]|uniref:Heat shock protein HslJ n=1 Tax=Microbacterium halimionae TaxID=1526413 RepID=A0A7W3JNF7_9MICO|nr:hypothetical protein [Microbacterium halimionae]MBA8816001.1 heat shock protein HslJ [Microbacterium halimionae]NII96204.1 heat shock protein HslJ [Microbacterium halimionae]